MLSSKEINGFLNHGYICLNEVIPPQLCSQIRSTLWRDTGVDPDDRSTWTRPVIRLGYYSDEPFRRAANMPLLHEAFDQLAGAGNWRAPTNLGSFPVRFPSTLDAGDSGWHVDASYAGDEPDNFMTWRINVHSEGRALLMLFLFSNVGPLDAPTRILKGSHTHVAGILKKYGKKGLSFIELASELQQLPHLDEALATGAAGSVYLCHPFIAHAAQRHLGDEPKFMAQPNLELMSAYTLEGDLQLMPPVEKAIVIGSAD
jgi:hypothetical protein